MRTRTAFLGRLIGLYCILVCLALAAHKQASVEAVNALIHNPASMLILGVIALATGLAMVLAHNVWSGGALPVVVTLVGWISLVKGLVFLVLTPDAVVAYMNALRYEELFYVYMVFDILLGLYLTIAGFRWQRDR